MNRIPVLLVDDSILCQEQLKEILEAEGDIQVVGTASDARDVLPLLASTKAQVLVTDLVMPHMGGLELVREVMRQAPLPILVVSAGGFSQGLAYDATRLGALEVAKKPELRRPDQADALRGSVRRISEVHVVRHPGVATPTFRPSRVFHLAPERRPRVLGIGASAGGPPAVGHLLGTLNADASPCVLVAQHMPPGHAADFAGFLSRRCQLRVEICEGPSPLKAGTVYVPADACDLLMIDSQTVSVRESHQLLVPSVDVLLESIAQHVGARSAGAVLSGIGQDGAAGLERLSLLGALTMVQDENSCAVYGMPKAAARHARHQISASQIAELVMGACPSELGSEASERI